MNAAFIPTTPPPITSTVAAATPGTPPSRMPRPPSGFSSMNAPACVAILPATSLIGASSGSRPSRVLDRLIRDARRARALQAARQLGLGREVQVGEQRLPLAQQLDLRGLRLLDLQHQLRLARTPPAASGDDRARPAPELLVGDRAALARAGLHEHLVPARAQLAHARRRDRDAVLVRLISVGRRSHAPLLGRGRAGRILPAHRASSRPRNASQNSMRSRALEKSRPVSCSTRRMR